MHIEHISIVDARLVAKAYTGLVMYHIGVLHIETDELTPGDQMLTKVCVFDCMGAMPREERSTACCQQSI